MVGKPQAPRVHGLVAGSIRDLFLKYGAESDFCLYLQHRHHNVGMDEAIVKVNGTANLMQQHHVKDIQALGNKLVPATWMGTDMTPMEFAVVPAL